MELPREAMITLNEPIHSKRLKLTIDFASISGHLESKRMLEIAAAGGHHVLLNRPPGCGKTMLADAFHIILPNLSNDDILETFGIYHLAKENRGFSKRPPYRNPHHSTSAVSLIGGGTYPKPGEITLVSATCA